MAISVVGTHYGFSPGGYSLTIPVGTVQNDYVVGLVLGLNDPSFTSLGYSTLLRITDTYWGYLVGKFMGASPDATLDVGSDSTNLAALWCLRGVDTSTPVDVSAVAAGATSHLDTSAVTTVTANAWVLSAGVHPDDTTPPAGYSNGIVSQSNGAGRRILGALKEVASPGSENPGAWTGGTSAVWTGVTIGFRPAAVAAGGNSKNMLLLGVG